jgi:hypothetical protein
MSLVRQRALREQVRRFGEKARSLCSLRFFCSGSLRELSRARRLLLTKAEALGDGRY